MANSIPFTTGQAGVTDVLQKASVSQVLNNGIEFAYENSVDTNGWANLFSAANMAGVMLRVTAIGATPPTGGVNWTASNTKIPHNLGKVPKGFLVTYKTKTCDVFAGTTKPDAQFIYLTITDDTATTNLFIF